MIESHNWSVKEDLSKLKLTFILAQVSLAIVMSIHIYEPTGLISGPKIAKIQRFL